MEELLMIRGDTLTIETNIKDANGNPIALSEIETIFCTLRKNPNSQVIVQKKLEEMTYEEGKLTVTFEKEDTQNLDCGLFVFDIEVTLTNGIRKSRVVQLEITEDITRHGATA